MTNTTLATLLTDAASADPDAEALVGLMARFSWRDYERASAAVAARLQAAGVSRGDRVAIGFAKDARSFIAIHGCLRIGAVVVPLDPLSPPMVARAVLLDAGVSALFVDLRRYAQLDPFTLDGLDLRLVVTSAAVDNSLVDADRTDVFDRIVADASLLVGWRAPTITPDDTAYIIYTSGSTGRPKGIMHTHASAMAYAKLAVEYRRLTSADRVGGMSPLHFDMSTLELYAAPLARSAVIVIGEAHLKFPASFTSRSQDERVSVWYFVPSFFRLVVERGALDQRNLSTLRLVMYGGEPYSVGALAELARALPQAMIENIYGPAEVNECTHHVITGDTLTGDDVPVGRAWTGVDLMVVDDDGIEMPAGTPGELWVSAPTVMSGYWRRPDLTEGSLHPREDGHPWYATGDVAVIDHDGLTWFKGRRDHQVKIRGVRLELEAVEGVLADAADVLHAVAVPVGEAGEATHVAAVMVVRDGATFDADALRQFCAARLPAVAVPREISIVTELPFTATGKIDRRQVRTTFAATAEHSEQHRTTPSGEASVT